MAHAKKGHRAMMVSSQSISLCVGLLQRCLEHIRVRIRGEDDMKLNVEAVVIYKVRSSSPLSECDCVVDQYAKISRNNLAR